jgi:hypothetical protein
MNVSFGDLGGEQANTDRDLLFFISVFSGLVMRWFQIAIYK